MLWGTALRSHSGDRGSIPCGCYAVFSIAGLYPVPVCCPSVLRQFDVLQLWYQGESCPATPPVGMAMLLASMEHTLHKDTRSTCRGLLTFCAAAHLMCSIMRGFPDRMPSARRDVVAPTLQAVADAAEALRSKGFVNYFGLQRFGAGVNATHQ